jgi:hypothetical protein
MQSGKSSVVPQSVIPAILLQRVITDPSKHGSWGKSVSTSCVRLCVVIHSNAPCEIDALRSICAFCIDLHANSAVFTMISVAQRLIEQPDGSEACRRNRACRRITGTATQTLRDLTRKTNRCARPILRQTNLNPLPSRIPRPSRVVPRWLSCEGTRTAATAREQL